MAGKIKVINNIMKFVKHYNNGMDRALNRMAIDIERLAKARVPVGKTGQLKASGKHRKVGNLRYHTEFNKEYAAYQEWGGDGKGKVVRNYTTPGTGKFYLKRSGDEIKKRAWQYVKQEMNRFNGQTI